MTTRETDEDVEAKQEGNSTSDIEIKTKSKASSSSAASSWSRLKDPRIVRVSRAFGGKDRHSKVCTVRGLRDRRVRLSVPTAIQLYDLQDRLGLNQPSKVVDWLLNAAKHEIDELPPLTIPPGSFSHHLQPMLPSHHHGVDSSAPQSDKEGLRIGASINWEDRTEPSGSNTWHSDAPFRPKSSKEVARGDSTHDKESWTRNEEEGKQQSNFENHNAYFSSNNFFSRLDHPSSSSLGLLNSTMPYNSMIRWDPSNLSLSQSGSPGLTAQQEDFHNFGVAVPLPSTVASLASGPQQVLVYHQPGAITQPYFPPHIAAAADYGGGRAFHLLGTTAKLLPPQNDEQEKQDGENGFHSR